MPNSISLPSHEPAPTSMYRWRQMLRWSWVLPLLAVVWFGPLEYRDLFRPDEGRYAEIAREMVVSGDWLTPRLNDLKYFEKPPLQYWATALAYSALGVEEWTARLWPAALGFLGFWALLFTGRRLFDLATGLTASLILASTLIYVLFGQIVTLDMGLAFFLGVSLCCVLLATCRDAAVAHRKSWILGAWVAAALAVLSKGPIGIVLPALILIVYCGLHRDWSALRAISSWPGIALFLVVAAPWFLLMQWRNPEFFDFFFLNEHIARFMQAGHKRPGAWYYFLVVGLVGALPWTTAMLAALPRAWRQRQAPSHEIHVDHFLLVWVAVIVGFFSLSSSKLPGYILPAFPALALLGARWAVHATNTQLRRHLLVCATCGVAMLLAAAVLGLVAIPAPHVEEVAAFAPWLALAGLAFTAATVLARVELGRQRRIAALLCSTLSGLVALQIVCAGTQSFAPSYSGERLIDVARAQFGEFDPAAPFYSVAMYDQTVPLHLGRTVTLVNYQDEMALGLRIEPEKGIATVPAFRQRWQSAAKAYAIMPSRQYEAELGAGTVMQVLARDDRYVLVDKPVRER